MTNKEKWSVDRVPDQSGKTVIITGANSGIGFEAAKALAAKGALVIMACRDTQKGENAADSIRQAYPAAKTQVKALDLANLETIANFVEVINRSLTALNVLINNAGVMAIPYQATADGFETQFGTNHLGHFALTAQLIDLLRKTEGSRVVTVSSNAHLFGRINFSDLNSEQSYQKWMAYGQSKLANLLFGLELQRRSAAAGGNPSSVVVHPGYAATNLQGSSGFFSWLNPVVAQSAEMGALPTLYAAVSDEIQGGEYIGPDGFFRQHGYPTLASPNKRALDQHTAKKLWAVSEELTGVKFEI
jgi:NAD(P)-dependent dehydrogenase (short-subunit alcohol dehydrogenase family)